MGTVFSFSLNEPATVTFSFTRSVDGRRAGGRCVAQTPKNRGGPRCKRTTAAGTLTFTGHSGTDKVAFQGRISPARRLGPGHYTLVIAATDAAGTGAATKPLSFTIVK